MSLPRNISELAEKNEALLAGIGFTPEEDDPFDLCNEAAYRRTNLFDDEVVAQMFAFGEQQERVANHNPEITRNIGMILIRPDMIHATPQFEQFIADRFKIIEAQTVPIDRATYWQIYQHDFCRRETMHCRLTRAALYIGSHCRLVVFRSYDDDLAMPTADYARGPIKGQQGVFQTGTLRGEIVYNNAFALDLHRLADSDVDERTKIATDPFAAFRKLSSDPNHPCSNLAHPLLFFTGVGVHIPDYSELHNDLSQFVDVTESPYAA